jgi:hypothetical protein
MAGPSGHYAMGVSSLMFIDACSLPGAVRLMRGVDDGVTAPLAMPFPFQFYGAPYNTMRPSADGYLILGPGGTPHDSAYYAYGPLPDPNRAAPAIFVLGGDLEQRGTTNAGICVATQGAAPNRRLIIESSDACVYPCYSEVSHLTFEIVLNEMDFSIDLLYQTLGWGAHSQAFDIGAQDALAQRALLIEYGNAPLTTVTSGTRLHLTWVP